MLFNLEHIRTRQDHSAFVPLSLAQFCREALKEYSSDSISSTLLPCRTVGVQGDARTYSSLVALSW